MSSIIELIKTALKFDSFLNKIIVVIFCLSIVGVVVTIWTFLYIDLPDAVLIGLFGLDISLLLGLIVLIFKNFFYFLLQKDKKISELKTKIILLFGIIAVVPTLLISIFSSIFFNFGIQSWFDDKVSTTLNDSLNIANSYIDEHRAKVGRDVYGILEDIAQTENMYGYLNTAKLLKLLEGENELRSINRSIIFDRKFKILAAYPVSSLNLLPMISDDILYRLNHEDMVEISFDKAKLSFIAKFNDDKYIYLEKRIDQKIINYIDNSGGAVTKYNKLRAAMNNLQIRFILIFAIVSLVIILVAMLIAVYFANYMIKPINNLLEATKMVKSGNLKIFVECNKNNSDELTILTQAFNEMVERLDHQQRDLMIAQRSMAWADVAMRVAHEIKNPLTPILLCAERLQRKFASEIQDKDGFIKYTDTILRHTKDIERIVSSFADFARMPSASFEKCEIMSVLNEFISSRKLINEKIKYEFISDLGTLEIVCDKAQIIRAIMNLYKNAEESLQESKIINPKIEFRLNVVDERQLYFIITDNGHGFPDKIMGKALTPYVTTRTKGTGLGLSIVQKIMQDHVGWMEISNVEPCGGCVKLIFDIYSLKAKLKN